MLRMAKAQGALSGGHLNKVQMSAIALLDREERDYREHLRDRDEWLAMRTALVANNPKSIETLFPQFFPSGDSAASGQALEDRIEQDQVTPGISDEIEQFIREKGGIMTGADLGADDEGWE